ncbi:hypothetical protein MHM582_0491 [Microbacterium sp. HM58-2]|nr:hypothetical protein MHM582_0491 [Microbacterium sp. HM58-2]
MDDSGELNDAQLLRRSRDGDRHAFSELWRRHAPIAVAYARSLGAAPPDPEDVVSEVFLRILHLLRTGKGPEDRFRPYLLTTVRNTWVSASRRAPVTLSIDDAEHPVSSVGAIDIEAMANSATIAEAFSSLPERWQHALWLSAVEQLPPRTIAEVLDLRPNSAAALTYRARDALRKAWIRAHLRQAPAGTEHARVIELLGSYAHDDLSPRSERLVTAHLGGCADCRAAAGEARHLARAMTLGPLLAGGTGLVIAPLLFPADQVAATTLTAAPGVTGWIGVHAPMLQPAADAAGHANPLLWPVAAAAAVALSVSGSMFVRPPSEPVALEALRPALVLPSPAPPATVPDPVHESDPVTQNAVTPPAVVAPTQAPAPKPQRKAKTIPTHPVGVPSFVEDLLYGVADAPSAKTDDERFSPYAVDESLTEAFAFAEGSADTEDEAGGPFPSMNAAKTSNAWEDVATMTLSVAITADTVGSDMDPARIAPPASEAGPPPWSAEGSTAGAAGPPTEPADAPPGLDGLLPTAFAASTQGGTLDD